MQKHLLYIISKLETEKKVNLYKLQQLGKKCLSPTRERLHLWNLVKFVLATYKDNCISGRKAGNEI